MVVLPPPLRPATFEALIKTWSTGIPYGESSLIYTPEKSGLILRIHQLLAQPELVSKYFENHQIVVIDLEAQAIEDAEDLTLSFPNEPTVIFLLGSDALIDCGNTVVLQKFNQLAVAKNLSVLCFVHHDFTHPDRHAVLEKYSTFWQNTAVCGLYEPPDAWQFLQYLEAKWETQFDETLKDEIVQQCGSHFWLIKSCCRHLRDTQPLTTLFKSDHLRSRLSTIWKRFLPSEQRVLQKIVANQQELTELEQHSRDFLLKSNWLKFQGTKLELTVPLLSQFIANLNFQALTVSEGNLVRLNGLDISHLLSQSEQNLIVTLWTHKNHVVSREKIAELVWGNEKMTEYSDWALDQLVSRLRKKLRKLGIGHQWLITQRKQGLMIKDYEQR